MAKNLKKRRLSDAELESKMIEIFEKGITLKSEVLGEVRKNFALGSDRYAETYVRLYPIWSKRKSEQEDARYAAERESASLEAVKAKHEAHAEIKKTLDEDTYEESTWDFKAGKVVRYNRKLTPLERKGLYERLAKMEGWDAPTKTADVNPDGTAKDDPILKLIQSGGKVIIRGK